MEAICRHLAALDEQRRNCAEPEVRTHAHTGETFVIYGALSDDEVLMLQAAIRELTSLGWQRVMNRPEPHALYKGQYNHPWWIDPVTGEQVRGFNEAMRIALERYMAGLENRIPSPTGLVPLGR